MLGQHCHGPYVDAVGPELGRQSVLQLISDTNYTPITGVFHVVNYTFLNSIIAGDRP